MKRIDLTAFPGEWIPLQSMPAAIVRLLLFSVISAMLLITGCSTPIGTNTAQITEIYENLNQNTLTSDRYSDLSARILNRFLLEDTFRKNPDAAISSLHDIACGDTRRDLLLALAELSFFAGAEAEPHHKAADYYLASAIYAYFHIFNRENSNSSTYFDRGLRLSWDLYNAALAHLLEIHKVRFVQRGGEYPLPVGSIDLEIRTTHFPYQLSEIEKLLPADQLRIYGLSVRNRIPGLGAPFLALEQQVEDIYRSTPSYPGTVFLRVEGNIHDLAGMGRGTVELYSPYERDQVEVNNITVPLELDLSVQLAYSLNRSIIWDIGRIQFLKGAVIESGVYPLQPYIPGRIPVTFVHGTFSTPAKWAEMINTLWADPIIRHRYQFWVSLYDSAKPISLSADELRDALSALRDKMDPEAEDDALNKMVVIGHSQGGLLTKLTAVNTGDTLLRSLTGKTQEDLLRTDKKSREIIQNYLIKEALPFVRRVVFISTPHRGSYLARNWVRDLIQNIVSLPVTLLKQTRAVAHAAASIGINRTGGPDNFTTSIDNMSPDNPGLQALADIPLAPGIKGHSIIAINTGETPPDGDDGVVKYTSAHIPYVESEFIIEDGHSCQSNPLVIEEVRRILLLHLEGEHAAHAHNAGDDLQPIENREGDTKR